MTLENAVRVWAGTLLLISLVLNYFVSPYWLWFSAFIGFMLIQSAFTGFCPARAILKKLFYSKPVPHGQSSVENA